MNPDDIVESFVSTIIIVVLAVIVITIWNQDVGLVLVDLLPHFVEMMVWLLLTVIILSLLARLFEEF